MCFNGSRVPGFGKAESCGCQELSYCKVSGSGFWSLGCTCALRVEQSIVPLVVGWVGLQPKIKKGARGPKASSDY